jgi:hypothetical protein
VVSAAYVGQGYPLRAQRSGRTFAVIGWEVSSALGHAQPLVVPIDAPGGQASTSKRAYVEDDSFAFSIPEPARELHSAISEVLNAFESDVYPVTTYREQVRDLVTTLRALLASWST